MLPRKLKDDGYATDLSEYPELTYAFADAYFVPLDITETITRQTYSLLDCLGDVGGLHDSLFLIVQFLLKPYQGFYQASIILSLFRFKPSSGEQPPQD